MFQFLLVVIANSTCSMLLKEIFKATTRGGMTVHEVEVMSNSFKNMITFEKETSKNLVSLNKKMGVLMCSVANKIK